MKTRKTARSAPARPSLKALGLWHPLLDRPDTAPARDPQHARYVKQRELPLW
jgi:hypothetical protein